MVIKRLLKKLVDKTNEQVDKFLRQIDDRKRALIAKDFESTVKFLMRKTKDGKGLNWLDELKYLERNPFVDGIDDFGTPFTKGRERKLTIRLIRTNYRIKKNGEIFIIPIENNEINTRCKSYEFHYMYYKLNSDKNDTEIKLHYTGFNISTKNNPDSKILKIDE